MYATQPSILPTNKLAVAALLGPAFAEVWSNITAEYIPVLAGDSTAMLAGAIFALLVGYFVPDRANVPS